MMPLKVVIIGALGHIGYAYETLIAGREAVPCGIASGTDGDLPDASLAGILAKLKCPFFESWEKMLEEVKPDIAVIGTRYDRNGTISLECLRRGIHCFTEKTIAHDFATLDELQKTAEQNHVKIFGMHGMRYEPHFFAAHQAVVSGIIGRPRLFFGQKSYCFGNSRPEFYKLRQQYGGTILWVAVHAIDLSFWNVGNWEKVSAVQSTTANHGYGDCESHSSIMIDFGAGTIGNINADFLLPGKFGSHGDDQIRIAGENGVIWVRDGKAYAATHTTPAAELQAENPGDIFTDICREIKGTGKCMISMEDTFQVSRLAITARMAADSGKTIVI